MSVETGVVHRLGSADVDRAAGVLAEAFAGYPVMRYVLGAEDPEYDFRLRELIGFFVNARILRNEPVLGVVAGARLAGVALVSFPGSVESPAALQTVRAAVWDALGSPARTRYETFTQACEAFAVREPHVHLNMIGVRPSLHGFGLGRRLIDEVHRLARADARFAGVTLTTEDPANLRFYERLGYERLGHVRVAAELESWGYFRPN
jgi:GNAT superfamily N-acetyltransferase